MKKIAVVTATRAEYGLLSPVIKELRKHEDDSLRIDLIVTGTHLSDNYGMTVNEIDDRIDYNIPVSVKSDTPLDISENQAEVLIKFTELFFEEKYNAVILLGDRYETLAVAIAAGNTKTPVFHLCGGDTTEGAIDEWIRHSITKISYLHFVTNEESKKRVIQLGENPNRVFNYGSTSVDNILSIGYLTKEEALNSIGLTDCKFAVCTYHPVTLEESDLESQIFEFIEAIKAFPDIEFIVTKSNADQGGAKINKLLDEAEKNVSNMHVVASLGVKKYLSLMKYSEFVLGNSSSGIIEAPVLKVPTVNIGDRQRGRLQTASIINCHPDSASIISAIKHALDKDFKIACSSVVSPYGTGDTAKRISLKAIDVITSDIIDLKKQFYEL